MLKRASVLGWVLQPCLVRPTCLVKQLLVAILKGAVTQAFFPAYLSQQHFSGGWLSPRTFTRWKDLIYVIFFVISKIHEIIAWFHSDTITTATKPQISAKSVVAGLNLREKTLVWPRLYKQILPRHITPTVTETIRVKKFVHNFFYHYSTWISKCCTYICTL